MSKLINLKNMVDICGGKMTLEDVGKEIKRYMITKSPKRMVVDIQRREGIGYYTLIYIPTKDFKKKSLDYNLGNLP